MEFQPSILISDREKRAIDDLRGQYASLTPQFFLDIETLFNNSRILAAAILRSVDANIYEGHLVMIGFVRRTYELLLGGIQEVSYSNRYLTAATLRGVIETFGAVAWLSEKPIRLPELVRDRGIPEGRLTNVAYKRIPGLKQDYKRVSDWIHPSSASFYTGLGMIDNEKHIVSLEMPGARLSTGEVFATLGAIVEGCHMILAEVQSMLDSHPELLNSGKVFAKSAKFDEPPR